MYTQDDKCLEEFNLEKGQQYKGIYQYHIIKGAYRSGRECVLITQRCGRSVTDTYEAKSFVENVEKGLITLL